MTILKKYLQHLSETKNNILIHNRNELGTKNLHHVLTPILGYINDRARLRHFCIYILKTFALFIRLVFWYNIHLKNARAENIITSHWNDINTNGITCYVARIYYSRYYVSVSKYNTVD